jgi:hypothetical protein
VKVFRDARVGAFGDGRLSAIAWFTDEQRQFVDVACTRGDRRDGQCDRRRPRQLGSPRYTHKTSEGMRESEVTSGGWWSRARGEARTSWYVQRRFIPHAIRA